MTPNCSNPSEDARDRPRPPHHQEHGVLMRFVRWYLNEYEDFVETVTVCAVFLACTVNVIYSVVLLHQLWRWLSR